MADRLYLGPVSKQLRGNREDALTLEREARIKVGYLFDSMMKGQTFKTGSWSLGNGRKIMAFVWNDVLGKRATVRLTGIGGEVEYIYLLLDTGWLNTEATEYGLYKISIWNDLVDYHGSHGLLLKLDKMNNTASMETQPQVDETLTYESSNKRVGYSAVGNAPSQYSGLTRLLAQALLGAERDDGINCIQDLITKSNELNPAAQITDVDPQHLGCIRSPSGDYWVVWLYGEWNKTESEENPTIDADDPTTWMWNGKAYAVKLAIKPELILLAGQINSGATRSIHSTVLDAFVLGYSSPTTTAVTLADWQNADFAVVNEAFKGVFDAGPELVNAAGNPVSENTTDWKLRIPDWGWGWIWKWQFRGATDEKTPGAIIVTARNNNVQASKYLAGHTTRVSTLAFSWDEETGLPTADFESEPDRWAVIYNQPMYAISYVSSGTIEQISLSDQITSLSSFGNPVSSDWKLSGQTEEDYDVWNTVLVWYDEVGDVVRIKERHYSRALSTVYDVEITGDVKKEIYENVGTTVGLFVVKDGDEVTIPNTIFTYTYDWYSPVEDGRFIRHEEGGLIVQSGVLYTSKIPGVFWYAAHGNGDEHTCTGWREYSGGSLTGSSDCSPEIPSDFYPGWFTYVFSTDFTYGEDGFSREDDTKTWTRVFNNQKVLCSGKALQDLSSESVAELYSFPTTMAAEPIVGSWEDERFVSRPLWDIVDDYYFYSRAAYNVNGYLLADPLLPGLCEICVQIPITQGAWIGGA